MHEYWLILLYAAMPAAGNFLGGVLAELIPVSGRILSLALHLAAGIVLAVVGIELMPQAIQVNQPWVPVLAFIAGSVFFLLINRLIDYVRNRFGKVKTSSSSWAIYFGVAVDLFSNGVMIGTGATVATSLGLLLAVGQVPADIPEGFANIATFKEKGMGRTKRLLLSVSFAVPILLGATIGYWGVRGGTELLKLSLLAFTAGILVLASVEEMLTEAHQRPESDWAATCLTSGFALFTLLSVYLK